MLICEYEKLGVSSLVSKPLMQCIKDRRTVLYHRFLTDMGTELLHVENEWLCIDFCPHVSFGNEEVQGGFFLGGKEEDI